MKTEKLLEFQNISKNFGGIQALSNVSLDLYSGEILALLGENGAGKSTLIKTLAGIFKPSEGEIRFKNKPYHFRPVKPHVKQSVAFIHQDLGLIEWMSIAENVGLAQGYSRRMGLIDWQQTEKRTLETLEKVGIYFDPSRRVLELTRTEKSLVAIARALASEADVLVLDEPTASLPADEVEKLFAALRPLKEKGVGMIYVSHRLDEIYKIADRVAVLRDGRLVDQKPVKDTSTQELVDMIVGKGTDKAYIKAPPKIGSDIAVIRQLVTNDCGPVDFEIKQGELLGLVGLRGAGQESVGRALFGASPYQGQITIEGENVTLSSPLVALHKGVGLIAGDRTEESIGAALSIRENAYINPSLTGRSWYSLLSPFKEAAMTVALGERVGLRPNLPFLSIESLSGGNQQKVIVSRWLVANRKLLVAEDPTAGVDVGAKAEIYRLIDQAMSQGLAVVVVSTDFEEIAHICHRALVFSRGKIVNEFSGDDLTMSALITAASASET